MAEETSPHSPNINVHSIPCAIQVPTGIADAKVDKYFQPLVRSCGATPTGTSEVCSSSFRGRPLKGVKVPLPQGYEGAVLADSNHRSDHHDNHCNVSINDRSNNITWYTNGKFNEFNYWTLDNEPTEDDKLMKAMKWIKASQHIHTPVLSSTTKTEE